LPEGQNCKKFPATPIFTPETPPKGGISKPNWHNIETHISAKLQCRFQVFNQILHSNKHNQVLFMGGPNMFITNQTWRTVAILEKLEIAISQQWFD